MVLGLLLFADFWSGLVDDTQESIKPKQKPKETKSKKTKPKEIKPKEEKIEQIDLYSAFFQLDPDEKNKKNDYYWC